MGVGVLEMSVTNWFSNLWAIIHPPLSTEQGADMFDMFGGVLPVQSRYYRPVFPFCFPAHSLTSM